MLLTCGFRSSPGWWSCCTIYLTEVGSRKGCFAQGIILHPTWGVAYSFSCLNYCTGHGAAPSSQGASMMASAGGESCSSLRKPSQVRERTSLPCCAQHSYLESPALLTLAVGSWERGHVQETLFSAFCLVKFCQLRQNLRAHLVQPWTLLREKIASKLDFQL